MFSDKFNKNTGHKHLSDTEFEKLISEQDMRFQVICSSKNDAIITSDESKLILFWNKGAEHIFGYTEEEALGKPITLIIPKYLHERHDRGMDRMNRGEQPRAIGQVMELFGVRKNGEEFPIELTLGFWDSNGKRYYSGIIRDTSEKKKAQLLTQEQEKRFHVISSSKNDAIITSDESKLILFWNKGAEHIFGYTEEEALGKPITLIIPKYLHERHDKGMDRMNRGEQPRAIGQVMELWGVRKSGEEFPLELTLGFWDNEGKRYYSGIIRDITEKKKAELRVLAQEKRFQVISSSKNDAIITSDESKLILFWNKGAEHIFGYTEEEAIGQPITLIIPKYLHERHDKGMDRMNKGEQPRVIGQVLELWGVRKSGEEFPLELTLGFWDNEGKRYYSGIIRDISEKRKADEIIKNEKEKADKLLLNILPRIVADELKNRGMATAKKHKEVSVLFTDFANFTSLSTSITPIKLVSELNEIFSYFDSILETYGIEKIKTIGDAYLAVCGLPEKNNNHACNCVEAAKQMLEFLEERNKKSKIRWEMRVGIHTGEVVAGVVGKNKFAYDLFGDTVNTANRLESNSEVGKINISETTYQLIKDKYKFIDRGPINAKGKGELNMYFVEIK